MHDSISTDGPQRPRARRRLGVLVGLTLAATPLALAPAAQAQAPVGGGPDTASTIVTLLQQVLGGLAHTLSTPLGEQAPNSSARGCKPTGLSELLSCVVAPLQAPLDPGAKAKARIKAKRVGRSIRWVK